MEDYYGILGISATASATEIRIAYKRLAMQYHPDRNAGDAEAEEMFKRINEAYHTLSDPLKKSRYDHRMNPVPSSDEIFHTHRREENRRKYWQWQQASRKRYRLDREYLRIQGLALLVFIVIAGFCFAVIHTAYYIMDQKRLARMRDNMEKLKHVNTLFASGKFDEAFTMVQLLKKGDPYEFRFKVAHDSLRGALQQMAETSFRQKDFSRAVSYFLILKNYEEPVRFETLQGIALSQYNLGNFPEALQALKQLYAIQPDDIQLIYNIALVSVENLDQAAEALAYLDKGKELFKKTLSDQYGEAFMIAMDGRRAPEIYYQLFELRARTHLKLKQYDAVRADCNWAIYLRPQHSEPYRLRAQANIDARDFETVCQDLREALKRGNQQALIMQKRHCR